MPRAAVDLVRARVLSRARVVGVIAHLCERDFARDGDAGFDNSMPSFVERKGGGGIARGFFEWPNVKNILRAI